MALEQLLARQRGSKVCVTLADDPQNVFPEGLGPTMVAAHAALLGDQAFRPVSSIALDQSTHLAVRPSIVAAWA